MNSSFFLTLIQFIVAFSVIAIVHETGHYLMAKASKIEVEEFGLGFPPRAIKMFKFRETLFSLNWIPFGAFVRPKGENDPEVPRRPGGCHSVAQAGDASGRTIRQYPVRDHHLCLCFLPGWRTGYLAHSDFRDQSRFSCRAKRVVAG